MTRTFRTIESAGDPILTLDRISKRFGARPALSDVSLSVRAGEIHAVLGENGAGKSTLCNIIFGVHTADDGTMRFAGEAYRPATAADAIAKRIAMVHQHFSLVPELSVVDNMMLGQPGFYAHRRAYAEKIVSLGDAFGLAVDPYANVARLSVGERQRVEILKGLLRDPALLVLDEPTAVLPPSEIEAFLAFCVRLAESGVGLLLITHKLAEIKSVADTLTVLRGGKVVARSTSPRSDLDMMVRAMVGEENATADFHLHTRRRAARPSSGVSHSAGAVQMDGLTVIDEAGVARLDCFSAIVEMGEILAVAGVEGNGQSELADVLSGMRAPTDGRFFIGNDELTRLSPRNLTRAGVGVVPEDRHRTGSVVELSVAQNLCLNRLGDFSWNGFLQRRKLQAHALDLMERFDVRAEGPSSAFGALSGGNQQKAVLARELTLPNLRFLIAVHPTRGLDVKAVAGIYHRIADARDQGAAVLLVSSELDELLEIADRVIVLYRGRVVGSRPGHRDERGAVGALMAGHQA